MRNSKTLVLTATLAMTAMACGGSSDKETPGGVEEAIVQQVAEQTGSEPSTDTTPCEILDDELVRAFFDVGPEVEIRRSPSKYSPHPLCTARWDKPNAEELEEQRAKAMLETMQKKMRGEDVEMPSFRSADEVSLTLYQPAFDSPAQARSSFEGSMKKMTEGVTVSHEAGDTTVQYDLTPIEGVGDGAMWAPKLRQLSVVEGRRIFHVSVNTGGELDAELEKAKAIAHRIGSEL